MHRRANSFEREVIAVLRPVLPVQTLDHVSFLFEIGQVHQALIGPLDGAVEDEVTVPPDVVETVRELLAICVASAECVGVPL